MKFAYKQVLRKFIMYHDNVAIMVCQAKNIMEKRVIVDLQARKTHLGTFALRRFQ